MFGWALATRVCALPPFESASPLSFLSLVLGVLNYDGVLRIIFIVVVGAVFAVIAFFTVRPLFYTAAAVRRSIEAKFKCQMPLTGQTIEGDIFFFVETYVAFSEK